MSNHDTSSAHSALHTIQDGGRRNFKVTERLFFENRKKISLLGKAFFIYQVY